MRTDLCLAALHRAQASRSDLRGAIHHTDRGVQYTVHARPAPTAEAARSG